MGVEGMVYKVFISHSVEDYEDVNELADILEENEIEPYVAE
jgi:hypothetical protein